MNLFRELTGGRKDECLDVFALWADFGEEGKPKGCGFAGTGLCLSNEVISFFHQVGDGLGLDGGGFFNTEFVEPFDEIGGDAQFAEFAHGRRLQRDGGFG